LLYLDSGVFIFAALSREAVGSRARQLLKTVSEGKEEASSCALTFDEVVWVVQKHRPREDPIAASQSFLALLNLTVLSVGQDPLFAALSMMRRYALHPRWSADAHFDRVKEIRRNPI